MISKDCAWMIRDIYRLAKHNLENLDAPAVEDGVVIQGEYHCIFRLRTQTHDSFLKSDEVIVCIAEDYYRGYIEFNSRSTVEKERTGSMWYSGAYRNSITDIVDPLYEFDFCEDFEASSFQAECISDNIPEQLVDAFVIHKFILDLIEDDYCFTLNTDLLMTDGKFVHDKVLAVHKYFFD